MIYVILGLCGLLTWAAILRRWQHGVFLLVLFLPFSGAVILWTKGTTLTILAKDLLIVVPLYIAFALRGVVVKSVRLPPLVILPVLILTLIVLLQMANPKVAGVAVALVGAKVWLFYIPLLVVTTAMVQSERDMTALLRAMVALVPIPCITGLVQYFGSSTFGHQETITAFYGSEAAAAATQGFSAFNYGGTLYRLPSTFVSVAHYFGYIEHSLVPTYAVLRCDPSRGWRRYAFFLLLLLVAAGFLSGARSAFIFVPMLLVLIMVFDRVIVGAMTWVAIIPALFITVLGLAGLDPLVVFEQVQELAEHNAKGLVVSSIADALRDYPLGLGTGMNTSAARHVTSADDRLIGFESQYAKTVAELGIFGLAALLAVFAAMFIAAWRARQTLAGSPWSSAGAAFAAYFLILPVHALKGWPLDWEPANVYFWMFAALILALPRALTAPSLVPVANLRGLWQQQRKARRGETAPAPLPLSLQQAAAPRARRRLQTVALTAAPLNNRSK